MAADTPWSDPGSTAGKPDRFQGRWLSGCFLSAGSNARRPDGSYVSPGAPWSCSIDSLTDAEAEQVAAAVPDGDYVSIENRPYSDDLRSLRVSGVCASQAVARDAAEIAAGIMSRRVASLRRAVQR